MTFFEFRIGKTILKKIETKNKTRYAITGAEVLRRDCFRVVLVAVAALPVPFAGAFTPWWTTVYAVCTRRAEDNFSRTEAHDKRMDVGPAAVAAAATAPETTTTYQSRPEAFPSRGEHQ